MVQELYSKVCFYSECLAMLKCVDILYKMVIKIQN